MRWRRIIRPSFWPRCRQEVDLKISEAIFNYKNSLDGADNPMRDLRKIMEWVLDLAPGRLSLVSNDPISADQLERFEAAVEMRRNGCPVSRIIGERAFWTHVFRVTDAVLDPRPETEVLVRAALEHPADTVLDLGTGSGCILISVLSEISGAHGTGTDISTSALTVAEENARRIGVADRMRLQQSDWLGSVEGPFGLVLSNPPYIAQTEMDGLSREVRCFDPENALTDGADGLIAYRRICGEIGRVLAPGGWLMVEIGPTQGKDVSALFAAAGLKDVTVLPDLDGRDRVVKGRAP
ncbi:peptide chain release factor N(5)-glutamine methyltransferase [Pseudooceanicola sp. C21-150M6]|uniref:peptide chain release factor N(5)-glutamine methyltransferase n=1 Tax=Pseudooceanicola sp. C21-150M6 TaxID=3434355 RepID=UPI003D7F5816